MEEKSGIGGHAAWLFAQKHALVLTLLLVLILQFVPNNEGGLPWGGMWMRLKVQELSIADSAASSSVENFVQEQASKIAKQQYPNLPEANRYKVVEDLKAKIREENKGELDRERKKLSEQIRDHYSYESDGRKFVYMPDIDPYHYLRLARNIIEKGHYYDELRNGVPWDNHMIAPVGTRAERTGHSYVLAWMYNIHSIFDPQVTLMQAATYFPIVFMTVSLIFAFLIAQRLSGNIGGFFAATLLALLPAAMGRTPWGHADTDAYNILFPLLAAWLLFIALSAKSTRKQLVFGALSGIAMGIYSNFWSGWWYVFNFIGAALAVAIFVDILYHRKTFWKHGNTRKFVFIGLSTLVGTAVISTLTIGWSAFVYGAFKAAVGYTTIKEAALPSLWPNVLTTVAELNPASLGQIVSLAGGRLIFIIAALGVLLLLVRRDEHGKFDLTYSSLLVVWFIGTTYMSLKGTRFVLLLAPALAIAFGVGVGLLHKRLSAFGERQLSLNKVIMSVLTVVIVGIIIVNPVKAGNHLVRNAYNSVLNDVPIMNDAWWNSLAKIKENSQPDAIINSWWDFGHHFKFVADRAVSFDGASQTLPHAHWVGRALQTSDEDEAVAILRMLDCGANNAFDVALNKTNDPLKSVKLVKEIIMQDKETAMATADAAGIPEIIKFTHCDAPEDFFIASGDMIGKSGVWAHFGLWDFDRAEVWQKWRFVPESEAVPLMAERFGTSEENAKSLYNSALSLSSEEAANQWISPWPGYVQAGSSPCSRDNDLIVCGDSIAVNLSGKQGEVRLSQGVAIAGKILVYGRDGNRSEVVNDKGNAALVIVMWPSGDGLSAIASYAEIADSIFTRLYFMNGLGLKHFKLFSAEQQLIGGYVYVYKVDWAGTEMNLPEARTPKDKVEPGTRVRVNYIGWLDDGSLFDSSIPGWSELNISPDSSFDDFDTKPMPFVVGKGMVIPGFESRIQGMKAGETKTVTIPPEEAYGTDSTKHKLGNKTLHFKLRIESIE